MSLLFAIFQKKKYFMETKFIGMIEMKSSRFRLSLQSCYLLFFLERARSAAAATVLNLLKL